MKNHSALVLVGFLVATGVQIGMAAEGGPSNYARPAELPVPVALVPLPPGAVEPAGWLRDWAMAAANGITGHLDEWSPIFRDPWKGVSLGDWPGDDGTLEQSSYWLDGLLRLGYALHDETLIRKATARLNLVVDGVNRGGKSFVYWKGDMPRGFNSWAHSQMGRALVGYYEATGDRRILNALVRAYRDYPTPMGKLEFAADPAGPCPTSGLCNLDAILETYTFSGDHHLLDCARTAMAAPNVQATVRDWLDGRFAPGHAVCAYELARLPALFHACTGEPSYLHASRNAFRWFDENHLLPYGVASGSEYLSGVGAFRLTETCNVVAGIWSMTWLYRIDGQGGWGDRIERAFFNAGPAPVARDFQTMCYYQSPNRIANERLPSEGVESSGHGCLRFSRFGHPRIMCCAGNVNRLIPIYLQHMWMATGDRGLAATLYGPCTVSALAGPHVKVKLACDTAYPFDEAIRVRVEPERVASFPLYFRIPAGCPLARVLVNGVPAKGLPDARRFVRVERKWEKGDTILLLLPMPVRIVRGFETEYPTCVRKDIAMKDQIVYERRRLPYESICRGPLLYALPIADRTPNDPVPDAKWQYALDTDPERRAADVKIERHAMPAHWDWPLEAPVALQAPARVFDWSPSDAHALPDDPVEGGVSETIRLVPYGCTKFRISMFPVTRRAWTGHDR